MTMLGIGVGIGFDYSPIVLPSTNIRLYLDGSLGVSARSWADLYVTDWASQAPAIGPVFSQIDEDKQPPYDGDAIIMQGDGSSVVHCLTRSVGSASPGLHRAIIAVVRQDALASDNPMVLDQFGSGSRLTAGSRTLAPGPWLWGWNSKSNGQDAGSTEIGTDYQVVTWWFTAGGNGIIRINGVQTDSSSYPVGEDLAGSGASATIGSDYQERPERSWNGRIRLLVEYSDTSPIPLATILGAEAFAAMRRDAA
jgi:hypothetical protein